MKLLILSDLHSNPVGARAILEKEGGADALYAAGDYTDYGPDPSGALRWVRENGVKAVYGNHDQRVLKTRREGAYASVPDGSLCWVHHNCALLTPGEIAFLESLPRCLCFEADGIAYMMQHQYGPRYEIIESRYHFDRYWAENYTGPLRPGQPRRMIFGHTHRQMLVSFGEDALWFNPGSASYRRPDEPSKDAFYAVVEDGRIRFDHVPYEKEALNGAVERLKPRLRWDEYHVAHYFFGVPESFGPDDEWVKLVKEHFSAENHRPLEQEGPPPELPGKKG